MPHLPVPRANPAASTVAIADPIAQRQDARVLHALRRAGA